MRFGFVRVASSPLKRRSIILLTLSDPSIGCHLGECRAMLGPGSRHCYGARGASGLQFACERFVAAE